MSELPLGWALLALAAWPARLALAALARRLLGWRPDPRLVLVLDAVALPAFVLGLRGVARHALGVDPGDPLDEELRIAAGIALCLLVAWLATRALDALVWRRLEHGAGTPLPRIAVHLVAGAVYVVAAMVIVALVLDRPLTGFLVSSSVVAGVLGLALQGPLSDLLAGVAISVERPYRIGDWLEVEGGFLGRVTDITWRSTRLLSWHDSVYVVPNSRAARAVIHNLDLPTPRYGHWFGVWLPAELPPAVARKAILEACLSAPEVLGEPEPTVFLRDLGHNPVEYRVFVYFRNYPDYFESLDGLLTRIWTQLRHVGVEPAAPLQDLRVRRAAPAGPAEPVDAELLRRVELFRCLSEGERQRLLQEAQAHSHGAGETIVREGEPGSSLFVVASGVARVTRALGSRDALELARLSVYDHFGEMSLLTGEPRSATVAALTDCRLLSIDKAALDEVLRARPQLVGELAASVARRRDRTAALLDAAAGAGRPDDPHAAHALIARIRGFFGLGEP